MPSPDAPALSASSFPAVHRPPTWSELSHFASIGVRLTGDFKRVPHHTRGHWAHWTAAAASSATSPSHRPAVSAQRPLPMAGSTLPVEAVWAVVDGHALHAFDATKCGFCGLSAGLCSDWRTTEASYTYQT